MEEKIPVVFSGEELRFLDWALEFLEGGPYGAETERQRDETRLKVRRALADYQDGISRTADRSWISVECAFCEGKGSFPEGIFPVDVITCTLKHRS